jgi:hypothetical protein
MAALLVAVLLACAAPARAAPPAPLPPPPALEPAATAREEPKPSRPRTVIRAPQPSAAPAAAATSPAPPAAAGEPEPLSEPDAGEELPAARKTEREVKIEQIRRSAGVTEIVVTPAFSTHSYVIVNREGARRSPQENQSSLSTPRFLRFDF